MPESRDRLSRPDDVRERFARQRQSIGGISILLDPEQQPEAIPFRWGATALTGTPRPMGVVATRSVRRGRLGTPGSFRRGGRGRSTNSVLPSWYPRTPLRDITAIARAIERRRASLRESEEGPLVDSPIPQGQNVLNVLNPSGDSSGAQLEHNLSMITPNPTVRIKKHYPPSVGKVQKILLDISNQNAGESDCLTPQKRLLNSIDTVEKVVMEELQKLKSTPTAKKAERQNKVRALMSMR